jgi:hypothetical protein
MSPDAWSAAVGAALAPLALILIKKLSNVIRAQIKKRMRDGKLKRFLLY